ncbi:MAG: hypothetical protein A3E85_02775 [Gammaproteobacteria bacterium RIFCSPHIGHO2_12_FULL_45_12]|nr:MAG: hypothetical protein A3E85_02775 [Gammaproteobacteria bacterium RIFCSPHIGHO2_12_FULL_45_12]
MKYKAIIFDFDGVLFDSERIHLHACNQVFQTIGFTIPEEKYFQSYVGLSDNEMFDLILNDMNIKLKPEQVKSLRKNKISAYKDYVTQHTSLEGVPGVKKFILTHAQTINNFAICSGATNEEIEATLVKLENGELRRYFKHIISIDDISTGKPSPEGYLLAANRLSTPPQHCLAIEDTPVGVSAAKNAGMTVVGITTSHDKFTLYHADFIADTYDEIDNWISD